MTSPTDVRSIIDEARRDWDQHRRAIVLLARVTGISVTELADRMGMTRQTMTGRLKGQTTIEPWELPGFAQALQVPREVVDMGQAQLLVWLAEHPSGIIRNRCFLLTRLAVA